MRRDLLLGTRLRCCFKVFLLDILSIFKAKSGLSLIEGWFWSIRLSIPSFTLRIHSNRLCNFQQMLPSSRKCVPLKIPMCIDLPYNSTVYPNLLNHQTQEDAEIAINQFSPLVKVRCSEDIKLFLCTVWVIYGDPSHHRHLSDERWRWDTATRGWCSSRWQRCCSFPCLLGPNEGRIIGIIRLR